MKRKRKKKMSQLPKLTGHAVNLKPIFSSFESMIDSFADGCSSHSARECNASAASIVYALIHPDQYNFQYEKYADNPGACARLLYVCLLAKGLQRSYQADKKIDHLIDFFEKRLDSNSYDFYSGLSISVESKFQSPEEKRAHLNYGILYSDLRKMLPQENEVELPERLAKILDI